MPFDAEIAVAVDQYALADLPGGIEWHVEFFDFLGDDPALQHRLGQEFFAARYMYKVLEGMRDQAEWAKDLQVRYQVLQYASIYEAALHHLLLSTLSGTVPGRRLRRRYQLKRYSIPPDLQSEFERLSNATHDGKRIVPAFRAETRIRDGEIRFKAKVAGAVALGLLDETLGKDIKDIYTARNAIHIHAELKRGRLWEINLSRKAYRRMRPFRRQVWRYLTSA